MSGSAPGEVLFRPRQAQSALYLVADGVVEVCRPEVTGGEPEPVAYLGPGATLAESKVITGTPSARWRAFPRGGDDQVASSGPPQALLLA